MAPRPDRASSFAVAGDRFVAVGRDDDVLALRGPRTRVWDARGSTIVPGLIDAHVHATHAGLAMLPGTVRFDGCRSIDDMLQALRDGAGESDHDGWVVASGHYDFDLVREGRFPTRWELDRAVPDRPLAMRVRGHLFIGNSRAMEVLGITGSTQAPPGGHIFRAPETGEPNGWLLDNAAYELALPKLPRASLGEWRQSVSLMEDRFLRTGVTSVVNQSGGVTHVLQGLRDEGALRVRWQANVQGGTAYFHRPAAEIPDAVRQLGPPTGTGDEWLRVGAIGEIHSDGLVEGARMSAPYGEEVLGPGWRGLFRHDAEQLYGLCGSAAKAGFQMEVHASGDAALTTLLDVYERVDREGPIADRRFVITHGGVFPSPADVERARRLGVIVSTQQPVLWTQSHYYRNWWGEPRASNLFANRTWLDGGVRVNGSTDDGSSVFLGMFMYVARKNFLGEVLGPDEAISRAEALRLYTTDAAFSSFEEEVKGSIEAGKLADFAVVSGDPLSVPEDEIKDIRSLVTVVGGAVAYRDPDAGLEPWPVEAPA
jgi:hypothetical protein